MLKNVCLYMFRKERRMIVSKIYNLMRKFHMAEIGTWENDGSKQVGS